MVERMETAENIFEDVVEPSYKKILYQKPPEMFTTGILWEDLSRQGSIKKWISGMEMARKCI